MVKYVAHKVISGFIFPEITEEEGGGEGSQIASRLMQHQEILFPYQIHLPEESDGDEK